MYEALLSYNLTQTALHDYFSFTITLFEQIARLSSKFADLFIIYIPIISIDFKLNLNKNQMTRM